MPILLRPDTYPVWLQLLLLVLATYRVACLVAVDEGPYLPFLLQDPDGFETGIFELLRRKVGVYEGQQTSLSRGIACPLCVGVYASLAVWLVFEIPYLDLFVVWLAIVGGQRWLYQIHGGG